MKALSRDEVVVEGSCDRTGGREETGRTCKDNTSKDPFSRCATCKNYGYSLS